MTFAFVYSCHGDSSRSRDSLVMPSLLSSRIYIFDIATDPKAPRIRKVRLTRCFVGAVVNALPIISMLMSIFRDAGTGGQEGQLPLLPFARRGKGGRSAL